MRRPHSTHQFASRNASSHQYASPTKHYYEKLSPYGNDIYDDAQMTHKSTQRRLYTEAPYFSHLLTVEERLYNKKVQALLDQYKHENLLLNKQIEVLLEDKKKAHRINHDFHLTNYSGNFNDSLKTHRKRQNEFQSKKKGKKYQYTSVWEDRTVNPQNTTHLRKSSQKQITLNSKKHETYFDKNQKPINTITSQVASNAQKQIISREAYLNRNTQTFIDNLSQSIIEKSFIEKRNVIPINDQIEKPFIQKRNVIPINNQIEKPFIEMRNITPINDQIEKPFIEKKNITPINNQTNNQTQPQQQNLPIQQQKQQDNLFYTVKKFIFGQQSNQEEKVQPFKQIEKQLEKKSQKKSIVQDIVKKQLGIQSNYLPHRNNKPYLQNYTRHKFQLKRTPKKQNSSSKKQYLNLITRINTQSPLQQGNRGGIFRQI